MKPDFILVNGDSYSAPSSHKVYSDFLQEEFDIPVQNIAVSGSNNDRILRSTVESMFDIYKKYQNPLVIIGWSFVRRLEVWYYGHDPRGLGPIPDKKFHDDRDLKLTTLDWLFKNNLATTEQKALINQDFHIHKQLVDFYTNLYMLSNMLSSKQGNYLFFSGAKNTDCPITSFPAVSALNLVQAVDQNSNIHKLHEFCIMHWAMKNDPDCDSSTGHLSEYGHQLFARYIKEELLNDI